MLVQNLIQFPDPTSVQKGPICYGGNLSSDFLLSAYYQGIFPWYSEGEPLLWWSPDPRFVLFPQELHISQSLTHFLKQNIRVLQESPQNAFTFTMDKDFSHVISSCALIHRKGQSGTWIHPEMISAYTELYKMGFAHSFETWKNGNLVGGFYGVLIGTVFFGESMFTIEPNASKCALVKFVKNFRSCGGRLIDSQVYTDNLARFGARNISRSAFLRYESEYLEDSLDQDLSSFYRKNNIQASRIISN